MHRHAAKLHPPDAPHVHLGAQIAALFARPDVGPWLMLAAEVAVSLIAIVALYWLARALALGGDVRIADRAHAASLAEASFPGFAAEDITLDITLDRARIGALVRNRAGRVVLIRRHGARFVARELTDTNGIRLDRHTLTLDTDDTRFGTLTLDLGAEAQTWAASLRRLNGETGTYA
ncbi:hypothetical protein [Novosphingobium sp.]|uniref:hypothetical protein n=1 Tax=Novosphingobium sp. TaxID=1874826 RepID=UPI003D140549